MVIAGANLHIITSFLTVMVDDFFTIRPSLTANKRQGLGYEFRSLLIFHLFLSRDRNSSVYLPDTDD